jgi:hypothetical protein
MTNVCALPRADAIPDRSARVHDARWLVSFCAGDAEMVLLMRHLHRVHNVLTVADFDAAGWSVVNTYPRKLPPEKLLAFYRRLGRKRKDSGAVGFEGNVIDLFAVRR